ncbi:MAG TPA: PH domain-containing protein [Gemmatimonadales bacterium]
MSYIDRHLLPGEVVVYRTRLHWKLFVAPVLVSLVMAALAIWALSADRRVWAIPPLVIALVLLLSAWIQRRNSEFAVTSKRVIIKLGVITTRSMELLLSKIEGITVTQSLMGRMFGYGEIVVTGSGGTQEPFDSIQSPLDFRQAVQAATEAVVSSK